MDTVQFDSRLALLRRHHSDLLEMENGPCMQNNGVIQRYIHPVLTAEHIPLEWRYDLNSVSNPYLMQRLGVNSVFNPGAIELEGKIILIARVEGYDRKSFFAIAESKNGLSGFRFWKYPVIIPQLENPDTNMYDMRLVHHEDGWIYGLFCTERRDTRASEHDQSAAIAQCGIVRTKDLKEWERLPDLITSFGQQRNVVLHPEFVMGNYAFYTRPQDGFIDAGKGGGIGWGLSDSIENAAIIKQSIIDPKIYHTIKEVKNGLGPAPIKTEKGWLHLAHGVRNTAAGLRYVLYSFLCDLKDPSKIIYQPGGYLMAPEGLERTGDVSNVLFCNGWVCKEGGTLYIYYASSDTRIHIATTTIDRMLDYVVHTPADSLTSFDATGQRISLIERNQRYLKENSSKTS